MGSAVLLVLLLHPPLIGPAFETASAPAPARNVLAKAFFLMKMAGEAWRIVARILALLVSHNEASKLAEVVSDPQKGIRTHTAKRW